MSTLKVLLGVLFLSFSCPTSAKGPTTALLAGEIQSGGLAPLTMALNQQHKGDSYLLFIDSEGGNVEEAQSFIIAIEHAKARGVDVRCHVLDRAESSAFWILVHCRERLALPQSMLLFHHIYIPEAKNVTARDAGEMLHELQMLDEAYLRDISRAVPGVSEGQLRKWMDEGAEWTAPAMARAMPGIVSVMQVFPRLNFMLEEGPQP